MEEPSPRRFSALITLIKITIAVVGIWWVARTVHWNDTADVAAGQTIREVTFRENVTVRVLLQSAAPNGMVLLRVEFPGRKVKLRVESRDGPRDGERVVGENSMVPGTKELLNLPREIELDGAPFKKENGQVIQEGLRSIGIRASAKWHLLLSAWILLGSCFLITAIRWRGLMVPQGIRMPLAKCVQLTFVGQFYSIILPGITGGDLVKIVYAARLTGSKTKSFITVALDRVIGLVALMVIAGASAGAQLFLDARQGHKLDGTLFNVFILIVALLGTFSAVAMVYFSRRLRRIAGIEWFTENYRQLSDADQPGSVEHQKMARLFRVTNAGLLAVSVVVIVVLVLLRWQFQIDWALNNMLMIVVGISAAGLLAMATGAGLLLHEVLVRSAAPLIRKAIAGVLGIDETLHVYRGHFGLLVWAFVISVISQLALPLSAWLSGMAFGMTAPATYYLAYVPLAVLAASLPISPPQGLGFMDWVLHHFFVEKGTATPSQAFALTQSVRFMPIIWNLLGAYWVITGKYSRKTEPYPAHQRTADTAARDPR